MKMTRIIAALAFATVPLTMSPAWAADTAAAAKPAYSTEDTDLGTLLDNAATKAILQKYIPDMISNPQIDMARSMTLKQLQSYAGDKLTDEALAKIDADLSALPAAK